jgi:hypothetical protein
MEDKPISLEKKDQVVFVVFLEFFFRGLGIRGLGSGEE